MGGDAVPAAAGAVLVGLVLLMLASDRLVVSAVRLSQVLGVSAILIGALVVGLGTSIPELLVSGLAAGDDRLDVAMANVVGSNVANLTLVLGAAALVAPVIAKGGTLRREGFLMTVALVALAAALYDGEVERWEGGALAFGLVVALYLLIRWSFRDAAAEAAAEAEIEELTAGEVRPVWLEMVIGALALAVTVFAADLLLDGASTIGERIGLGDAFLGVMLGVGTSLPELATAMAAIRRRESDLVVGNVLGSNVFNSLAVAGTAGLVGPAVLLDLTRPALWVMLGAAVAAGAFSFTGRRVVRWEAAILLGGFVVFAVASY